MNTNTPLVTIVTLCYKKFDHIFKTIDSVLSQTYPNIEYIIADDGSDNFPESELTGYIEKNKGNNIKLYHILTKEKNEGTVKNFNSAVNRSSGNIILPLSEDDTFFDKDVVFTIVKRFTETDCMLCTGKRIGEPSGAVYPSDEQIQILVGDDKQKRLSYLLYDNFISGSVLYYKKDLLKKLGGFDERFRLLEDHPFVIKAVKNDIPISFIDKPLICYNEGGVSERKHTSPVLMKDYKALHELIIFDSFESIPSNRLKRYITYRYKCKCFDMNVFQFIACSVKYIDVFLCKLKIEASRRLFKKQVNEFYELYRVKERK